MKGIDNTALPNFFFIAESGAKSRGIPFSPDQHIWGSYKNPSTIDEQICIRQVRQHKLVRSVYETVKQDSAGLNEQTIRSLKRLSLIEGSIKIGLFQKIQRLQKVFSKHTREFLVMKGPASSLQLYGDALLRGYTDLDLLVNMNDFQEVVPLMKEAGYYLKEGQDLTPGKSSLVQLLKHAVFFCDSSPFRIEVHAGLFDDLGKSCRADYSAKALFTRSVEVVYNECTFRTLNMADHALFIIAHGTKHGWSLLHWLFDAAKILQIEDRKFHEKFSRQAELLGSGRKLAFSITLVKSLFPIAVPDAYSSLTARYDGRFKKQLNYSCRQLVSGAGESTSFSAILSLTYRYRLPLAEERVERSRILTSLLKISPQDTKTLPLPKILYPLHLLIRPFFVVQRRLSRLLRKPKKMENIL